MGVILAGVPFADRWRPCLEAGAGRSAGGCRLQRRRPIANVHLAARAQLVARLASRPGARSAARDRYAAVDHSGIAELWPHGPDALLHLGEHVAPCRSGRYVLAGVAIAPGVLVSARTLPSVGSSCLAVCVGGCVRRPALRGAASACPTSTLHPRCCYCWNGWYYGVANVGGAYQGKIDGALAGRLCRCAEPIWPRDRTGHLLSHRRSACSCYSPFGICSSVTCWSPSSMAGLRPPWVSSDALRPASSTRSCN